MNCIFSLILILTLIIQSTFAYAQDKPLVSKSIPVIKLSPEQFAQFVADSDEQIKKTEKIELANESELNALMKYFNDVDGTKKNAAEFPRSALEHLPKLEINSGEIALFVLIIVGLVVYATWLVYFPVLAFTNLKRNGHLKYLNMLSIQHAQHYFENRTDESRDSSKAVTELRQGFFSSINYNFFMRKKKSSGLLGHMGIGAEAGYYHFKDHYNSFKGDHIYEGPYSLIGPSFLLTFNRNKNPNVFGTMDLLFGTSYKKNIGVITGFRLNFNYLFTKNYFAGLGVGFTHINTKNDEGILNHTDQLMGTALIKMGLVF